MLINISLYTTNAPQCKHSIKLNELKERPNSGIYGLGAVLNTQMIYLCSLFSLSDNEMFLYTSRTLVAPSSIVEEPIMSERLSWGFHLDIQSVKQTGSESKKNINGLVEMSFCYFQFSHSVETSIHIEDISLCINYPDKSIAIVSTHTEWLTVWSCNHVLTILPSKLNLVKDFHLTKEPINLMSLNNSIKPVNDMLTNALRVFRELIHNHVSNTMKE